MTDERGQAFTLEGIVSGVIVLTALMVALQTISVAPGVTGSDDSAASLRTQANDLMSVAADEGYLEDIVLCGHNNDGDPTKVTSNDISPYRAIGNSKEDTAAVPDQSATDFGDMIRVAFTERGYNYRVEFAYLDASGDRQTQFVFPLSASGSNPRPAARDPAVVATHTVTLFDDMRTTGIKNDGNGNPVVPTTKTCDAPDGVPLSRVAPSSPGSADQFYLPDVDSSSDLYNIVEVRLVVW